MATGRDAVRQQRQRRQAKHITSAGLDLGSFQTGLSGEFDGLALGPDGNSLYATTFGSSVVRHFDLAGTPLSDFTIDGEQPDVPDGVESPTRTGSPAVAAAVAVAAAGVRRRVTWGPTAWRIATGWSRPASLSSIGLGHCWRGRSGSYAGRLRLNQVACCRATICYDKFGSNDRRVLSTPIRLANTAETLPEAFSTSPSQRQVFDFAGNRDQN